MLRSVSARTWTVTVQLEVLPSNLSLGMLQKQEGVRDYEPRTSCFQAKSLGVAAAGTKHSSFRGSFFHTDKNRIFFARHVTAKQTLESGFFIEQQQNRSGEITGSTEFLAQVNQLRQLLPEFVMLGLEDLYGLTFVLRIAISDDRQQTGGFHFDVALENISEGCKLSTRQAYVFGQKRTLMTVKEPVQLTMVFR
jgi:hypothetical protein